MAVVRYEDARGRGAYAVETGDCVTVSTPGVRHDHEFADMAEAVGWMESKGYRPQPPTHREGHGSSRMFREQLERIADDMVAGFMTTAEFGQLCERAAEEYAGWSE